MFKNDKIKRFLKTTVFPILTCVNKIIPKDDHLVLLYSPNRGIEHNLKPLRDYMLEHKYNTNYRIICCVSSAEFFENDGLEYVTQGTGIKLFLKSRHVFYTTGQIPIKPSRDQIVIQMDHGATAIKTEGYLKKRFSGDVNYFTLYCAPSEAYREIIKKAFRCSDQNIVINSEPVTDVLYGQTEVYDFGDYCKLGIWAPTFRKSDYLGYDDSTEEDLLPTLKTEDYEQFNELLKKNDIKIVAKLHDMQDLGQYKNVEYSNLLLYSSTDFNAKGYKLYDLMKQSDFMIADYSSVYLQYLPLDKPVGFAIPDIADYRKKRGFWFEPVEDYMPGPQIKTKEQLFKFIEDIASEKDEYSNERMRVNKIINQYQDGKSCERLIQYSQMK